VCRERIVSLPLGSRRVWRATAVAAALAALSLLLVAPAPSYDPWMWLLWGREVAEGGLDTRDGPAFKPLPVAVCALLAPLGQAAPVVWIFLVRTAALLAVWLAWRLGRRLAGGSALGGGAAAVGVLLCGRLLGFSASGAEPALVLAAGLGALEAWAAGRERAAVACALACGLLRVEAWPFLLALGALAWRRRPEHRVAVAAAAVLLPAAWLVPEWVGSGDALRSGARARVPNPGQAALASFPGAASLREAVVLPPWPLWIGVAALVPAALRGTSATAARAALGVAGIGVAWILVVAAMAQVGFSGEPRYALPGAALVAVGGAAGLALAARGPRPLRLLGLSAAVLLAVPIAVRVVDLPGVRAAQADQWRLGSQLADAVREAGGRRAVLRCGTPYVGRLRGPLMAYRLHVAKERVEPDAPPRTPGVVFRSALTEGAPRTPDAPAAFTPIARTPRWDVLADCGVAASS
jgi:hypothetical protein